MSAQRRPRRSRILAAAAAIVALLALPFGAAPAFADQPAPVAKYVALGDSYAAGQGGGDYLDTCLRSPLGYPSLIDAVPRFNLLREPACSGATIGDVASDQLSQLNAGTTLVTVTAGANDLGIAAVYAACVPNPQTAACAWAIQTAQNAISSVGPDMAGLIAAVAAKSPRATIVVTGYPVPFTGAVTADPIVATINTAVAALDAQLGGAVLAQATAGVPVVFVPVWFGEHAIGGTDVPWLGYDPTDAVTFLHPNALGYVAYRDAILAALP